MLAVYQHLPEFFDPIAFSVLGFPVRWYSIMYLAGFMVVYALLLYRIKIDTKGDKFSIFNPPAGEAGFQFSGKGQVNNFILDLLLACFVGLLIGARLGYVFFYNATYYWQHPLEIILPVQLTSHGLVVTGIAGMSYFGGLLGVIVAGYFFAKKRKMDFLVLADFVVPAVPAGYFFGRLGNFLNGELFGRVTSWPGGMYFPADPTGLLRHPSQLYEAFFEGLVLFIILWLLRNKKVVIAREFRRETARLDSRLDSARLDSARLAKRAARLAGAISGLGRKIQDCFVRRGGLAMTEGGLTAFYLFLYGFFRFFIEFFRQPDPQIGLIWQYFTLGQIFSLVLVLISSGLACFAKTWKSGKIKTVYKIIKK